MLSATILFPDPNVGIESLLLKLGFKKDENMFTYMTTNTLLIEAVLDPFTCSMKWTFSPGLTLEEYTAIHSLIKLIKEQFHLTVDDRDSLLGYTSNGEEAYIFTNWEKWFVFLQDAKLKTLEGNQIRILDEANKEIASGMFVSHITEKNSTSIIECTVITIFGEKTFIGNKLTIQPTNEW